MWQHNLQADARRESLPQSPPRTVAVLLNANARKVSARVERALEHIVPKEDLFVSRSSMDVSRIAEEVIDRGFQTVFIGGGDGTVTCFVNEILNQIASRAPHETVHQPRFGILKLGTGNSVASWVQASTADADGFVDDVLRGREGEVPNLKSVDLMMIDGKRAPFAGLGLDGKLLNDYSWVKNHLGQGAFSRLMTGPGGYFTSVAFKTVPYYLTHSTSVDCEVINGQDEALLLSPTGEVTESFAGGSCLYRGPLMMAAAGTVPFYGFELRMFPFAGLRKGHMNLRLGTVPPTAILANLPKLWAGTWFPEGLKDFLVKDVTIRFSRPMPLQVAGDAEGYRNEVRFEMARERIELLDFGAAIH
jgi:diacylglycerol kinase family enzyme